MSELNDVDSSSVNTCQIQDTQYYSCSECYEHFKSKAQLIKHSLAHETKYFGCSECHESYNSDSELSKHLNGVHKRGQIKLKCDLCSKEYKYERSFLAHCEAHFNASKKRFIGKQRYHCSVCEKTFDTKVQRDLHFHAHSIEKPYVCKICCEKFACVKKYGKHNKTHEPITSQKLNLYQCTLCSDVFDREIDFWDHENFHSGVMPYQCGGCDLKLSEFKLLEKHVCTANNLSWFCILCTRLLTTKMNMKRHIIAVHLKYKQHKCKICLRKFSLGKYLKRHLRSHTGEKPYICDVCQKSFSVKYNLNVHYRIHTGEKPFQCNICQKSFRVKVILDEHYKVHKIINKN